MIALSVLGRTVDTVGTNDAAANFLCDLASLVYVDPEITENIQKVVCIPISEVLKDHFFLISYIKD